MTDKTFTDEEIVKALEHCSAYAADLCPDCPMFGRCHKEPDLLEREALALINRQKAEIERLRQAYANYEETTGLKQAKTEAIKKFVVCLNEKLFSIPTVYNSHFGRMIDATIKEMTEGEG